MRSLAGWKRQGCVRWRHVLPYAVFALALAPWPARANPLPKTLPPLRVATWLDLGPGIDAYQGTFIAESLRELLQSRDMQMTTWPEAALTDLRGCVDRGGEACERVRAAAFTSDIGALLHVSLALAPAQACQGSTCVKDARKLQLSLSFFAMHAAEARVLGMFSGKEQAVFEAVVTYASKAVKRAELGCTLHSLVSLSGAGLQRVAEGQHFAPPGRTQLVLEGRPGPELNCAPLHRMALRRHPRSHSSSR